MRGRTAGVSVEVSGFRPDSAIARIADSQVREEGDVLRPPTTGISADRMWLRWGKRLCDLLLAGVLLLVSSWLICVLAGVIIVIDGRPALYRRRVVGRDYREFDAFKLRSMVADADELLRNNASLRAEFELRYKLERDPRVTRVGRFLRMSSLDELPQLVNVLKGDMSLIGPRMMTRDELRRYGPDAGIVVSVRPGLSGLWQVSGRQLSDPDARRRYDIEYVRRASFVLDASILARTVWVVLARRGAW